MTHTLGKCYAWEEYKNKAKYRFTTKLKLLIMYRLINNIFT